MNGALTSSSEVIIKNRASYEQMFHVLMAGCVLAPSFHRAYLDDNKQIWLASVNNDIWLTINPVIRLAAGGSGNAGAADPAQLSFP